MIPSSFFCSKGPWRKQKSTHIQESAQIHESSHRRWCSAGTCPAWWFSPRFRGLNRTWHVSSRQYLAVRTVDESSFGQQVTQQGWQVPGQRRNVQDFCHPTRHVHHGLMGEAHIQGSVASFQPAVNRFQVAKKKKTDYCDITSTVKVNTGKNYKMSPNVPVHSVHSQR